MRVRLFAAAAALALMLPTVAGASPALPDVVDVPDAGFSSDNVHLVTTLQGVGSGVGGKFVTINDKQYYILSSPRGGFWIPTGVGTGGVWAIDVSNPEQPVPAGFLPIPLEQNEDIEVSATRKIALFSATDIRPLVSFAQTRAPLLHLRLSAGIAGALVVVDLSNPNALKPLSVFPYPMTSGFTEAGSPNDGPGHTATCVMDCQYVYVTGGRGAKSIYVIDLRDPAAPKEMGWFATPAGADGNKFKPGVVHDAHVDRFGNVWMVGSGGTAMYAPITDPMKPKLLATVSAADNKKFNQLIHHGAVRLDKNTVIIGEEDFGTSDCGSADGKGAQDGSLQTWRIDTKTKRLTPLGSWDAELATDYQGALATAAGIVCSSHWFDVNSNKVVADGFYEQGVRFLDISNPKKIRQVGYWIAPGTAASQAQFVPGRNDLLYVADYARGIDVLRLDNGGARAATVKAPIRAEWLAGYQGIRFTPEFVADETYGYACKRPKFSV